MMQTSEYLNKIICELDHSVKEIHNQDAEKLVNAILESNKIFIAGAGRSGFMGKSFAMRMMHIGLDSNVIGETITSTFEKDDLLIIGSGSGETKSLITIAEKAKNIGGKIAAITIFPESTIGQLADMTVELPGAAKDHTAGQTDTIQPMGSLFEQTLLLFYDAIILRFMEKKGLTSQKMYGKHANLE